MKSQNEIGGRQRTVPGTNWMNAVLLRQTMHHSAKEIQFSRFQKIFTVTQSR